MLLGDIRNGLYVGDLECRIRGSFEPDELGAIVDGLVDSVEVGHVDHDGFDAHLVEDSVEEPVGAAVHIVAKQNLVARAEQVEHRAGRGDAR